MKNRTATDRMSKGCPSKWKHIIFGLLSMMIGLSVLLLASELILRFLPVASSMQKMIVDETHPILHFPPNKEFVYSKGWNFEIVNVGRFNNYGFVNRQDYQRNSEDILAIVGDSYVEALLVPYEETLQGRLAALYEGHRKVYSFAISGSQLAQYLVFGEYVWTEFRPREMVFVIVGNDFDESALKVRDGLHIFEHQAGDPGLRLVRTDYRPSTLETLLGMSATARYLWTTVGIYDPFRTMMRRLQMGKSYYVGNTYADPDPARLRRSEQIVDTFFAELPGRVGLERSQILFVVDGIRPHLYDDAELKRAQGSYFDLMRRYFIRAASERGYEVIDMQPLFKARHDADGSRFEFPIDAHWNGNGHRIVAEAVVSSNVLSRMNRPVAISFSDGPSMRHSKVRP